MSKKYPKKYTNVLYVALQLLSTILHELFETFQKCCQSSGSNFIFYPAFRDTSMAVLLSTRR